MQWADNSAVPEKGKEKERKRKNSRGTRHLDQSSLSMKWWSAAAMAGLVGQTYLRYVTPSRRAGGNPPSNYPVPSVHSLTLPVLIEQYTAKAIVSDPSISANSAY